MNTLGDLREMTVMDAENWSCRTLDIPDETKALIERAESVKINQRTALQGCPDVYTWYTERKQDKGKGEDLVNDICAVFDNVVRIIERDGNTDPQAQGKKQSIRNHFNAMYEIRNKKGTEFDSVRTVMGSQLPGVLPLSLKTDYNVMIYTVAKSRVDACLNKRFDTARLREVLETHFRHENNIISNCVDIPLIPYIESSQKEAYFRYLGASVTAISALTNEIISYISWCWDQDTF